MGCGRSQIHKQMCQDCQRWTDTGTFHNVALFDYNEAMKRYFQQYKFRGDYQLRYVFMAVMQQAIAHQAADQVLSVPVTPTTMQTRGFNQVTGWLAEGLNQTELVTKAKTKAVPQSQKDRQMRLQTPQPFELVAGVDVIGQRILIVDDIYTTGRTIRHAATLLMENGAKAVTGLTLAR